MLTHWNVLLLRAFQVNRNHILLLYSSVVISQQPMRFQSSTFKHSLCSSHLLVNISKIVLEWHGVFWSWPWTHIRIKQVRLVNSWAWYILGTTQNVLRWVIKRLRGLLVSIVASSILILAIQLGVSGAAYFLVSELILWSNLIRVCISSWLNLRKHRSINLSLHACVLIV